jgi:hypothetical protein
MRALHSLGNIKLNDIEVEVIVIKNFNENIIDDYLRSIQAKVIIGQETPLCSYVYLGIVNSTGKYLFFLEDDDLFFANKISYVTHLMDSRKIDYYHNAYVAVNENLSTIKSLLYRNTNKPIIVVKQPRTVSMIRGLMRIKGDINLSSICISRDLIERSQQIDFLKDVSAGPDWFLFYLGIQNGGALYFDDKILTRYFIHESTANTKSETMVGFKDKRIYLLTKEVKSLLVMLMLFSSPGIQETIKRRITTDLLQVKIIGYTPKLLFPENKIKPSLTGVRRDLFGVAIIFIFLVHKVSTGISLWLYSNILQRLVFGKSFLR